MVGLGGIDRFHLQTKKTLNRKGRKEVRKERKENRESQSVQTVHL
jgi:hypothetical protein